MLFSGSLDLFSNAFFRTVSSVNGNLVGNDLFCSELIKWVFSEKGVLRFRNITHHKSDGSPPDVILHEKARPDLPQSLYPDPEITRNSLGYIFVKTLCSFTILLVLLANLFFLLFPNSLPHKR